jgi:hypothetical protein
MVRQSKEQIDILTINEFDVIKKSIENIKLILRNQLHTAKIGKASTSHQKRILKKLREIKQDCYMLLMRYYGRDAPETLKDFFMDY